MTAHQSGKPVKLKAEFRDSDNTLFDPTINSVEILNYKKEALVTYSSNEWVQESTGVYYLLYTLPEGYAYIYHKWNITDANDVSDTEKQKIEITYV
jgi:hypothetical protein